MFIQTSVLLQTALANYHRLGGLDSNLFFIDLEAGSPGSRRQRGQVLARAFFWVANS